MERNSETTICIVPADTFGSRISGTQMRKERPCEALQDHLLTALESVMEVGIYQRDAENQEDGRSFTLAVP